MEAEKSKFKGNICKNFYDGTMSLFNKIGARDWVTKDVKEPVNERK